MTLNPIQRRWRSLGVVCFFLAGCSGVDTPSGPSRAPDSPGSTSPFLSYTFSPEARSARLEPSPSLAFGGDMWADNNRLSLSVLPPVGAPLGSEASLTLAAPRGQRLAVGVYRNARRIAAIGSSEATLDFSVPNRGCNTSTGEFEVFEAVYGPQPAGSGTSGTVERFRARFSLTCDGTNAGAAGEVLLVNLQRGCRLTGNC